MMKKVSHSRGDFYAQSSAWSVRLSLTSLLMPREALIFRLLLVVVMGYMLFAVVRKRQYFKHHRGNRFVDECLC
jgi:hypothetical protein